jgi:hypothetical protein
VQVKLDLHVALDGRRTEVEDYGAGAGPDLEADANAVAEAEQGLPRIAMLEAEYQRAVLEAEAAWVRSVIAELRSGALTWSREELMAFAEAQER